MNNNSSRRLATTAAALLGCFVAASPAQEQCSPGNCRIAVTVTNCQAPGGITVDLDPVPVDSPRNMRWEIVTPGYVFPANGIDFSPPNAQFEPKNSPKANEVHIFNRKTQNGDFYYYINITDGSGNACARADPTVRNN